MYKTHLSSSRHALAGTPPVMPIDILLAFPYYVTKREVQEWLFNLPGAINDIMGSKGWERAVQVMKPYVWAPQWTHEELYDFAARPFGRNKYEFPKIDASELRGGVSREYEIVHFCGNFRFDEHGMMIGAGETNSYTRLLILQNHGWGLPPERYLMEGAQLAKELIAGGGPPVLVMAAANTPEASNRYLADVYANIVHDRSLSEAARPHSEIEESVWVELFLGDGGDELLRLSHLRDRTYARVETVQKDVEVVLGGVHRRLLERMGPYLDVMSVRNYEVRAAQLDSKLERQASDILKKAEGAKRELDFSRETGGAIPLAESQVDMAAIDKEVERLMATYSQTAGALNSDMEADARTAKRGLNAGFVHAQSLKELGPRDPLIAGQEYDFLIDVGPEWDKTKSLVKSNEGFPEQALPPDEEGYPVHVVFISDDLDPKFYSAWIYVPRHTGRSFPYDVVTGQKVGKSGPIAFRFKAPALDEPNSEIHGRLCLYYRNNLLQSARVYATVALTSDFQPQVDTEIAVDYVISGKVQNLDEFAIRKLKFTPEEVTKDHPVTVNITLNDDGKEHRLLVRQLDDLPTTAPGGSSPIGWTPFDDEAARKALEEAREVLKTCFFLRDTNTGKVMLDAANEPKLGFTESNVRDQNNRKSKEQFLMDLQFLAELGRGLFRKAFGDVRPEGNWASNAAWTNSLRKSLEKSSIIQIARTGPANYVFPWSLIYQYPLPGPPERIKHCRVTKEWDDSGKRNKPLETSCPFRSESWHTENILCPYGFWGLNHIIEQPIPALRKMPDGKYVLDNVTDKIVMGATNLDLSVSITHDLSPDIVKPHLKRLGAISPFRFSPPDPADNRDKVRSMLKAATVVYFLCHGEYDTNKKEPYLSIGLRDGNDIHRIYPGTLVDWADAADLTAWEKQKPLIFINGCHTTNLTPGEVLNFVTAFGFAGAAGVIGTEISVLANVATEIAESMFEKVVGPARMPVGQAMYQTRWELANKGNLLGLAYTLYCLANLHVTEN